MKESFHRRLGHRRSSSLGLHIHVAAHVVSRVQQHGVLAWMGDGGRVQDKEEYDDDLLDALKSNDEHTQ